jgi:hypothetical protein
MDSVLHREVTEQRVRLGIIKLCEHPLPELLRTKNYVSAARGIASLPWKQWSEAGVGM